MRLRIAQLANFVGPESGGMKIALEALGQGYVDAGHERILIIPGERDEIVETEEGKEHHKRVKWWSALALLRSIASSPAAAAATGP